MRPLFLILTALIVHHIQFAQPVILHTDWSQTGILRFENTSILPVKDSGEFTRMDTVTYYGTLAVVDPTPGNTIMEFMVTGVAEPTGDLSENGLDLLTLWMAMTHAGKVTYRLKEKGTFDTILEIENLAAAVERYCHLLDYDCLAFEDETGEEEDGWRFDMTGLVENIFTEGVSKKLDYIHGYAGDTLVVGKYRDMKDFPDWQEAISDPLLKDMDISGESLLLDRGEDYVYESIAIFDMNKMMQMMYEMFANAMTEEDGESGKKKKKKKGKDAVKEKSSALNDMPDMSMELQLTYILSKPSLIPMECNMETTSRVKEKGSTGPPVVIRGFDLFKVTGME